MLPHIELQACWPQGGGRKTPPPKAPRRPTIAIFQHVERGYTPEKYLTNALRQHYLLVVLQGNAKPNLHNITYRESQLEANYRLGLCAYDQ